MNAITIFEKYSFIFSFVNYELVIKSLGARCTLEVVAEKRKCEKMNVNFLLPNKMNHLTWLIGGKIP
jgi:hypothetical protein